MNSADRPESEGTSVGPSGGTWTTRAPADTFRAPLAAGSNGERDRALLLQAAWDHANDGILIADARQPDYPILYASQSFEKLTGYSADEVIGRNCRFLQGPETDRRTAAAIRAALEKRLPFKGEILNYRKNGEPFWNLLHITPLRDSSGHTTHFVGVQVDITEQKRVEQSLHQRVRLNELSATISATFVNLPPMQIDTAVEGALQQIAEAFDVDQSALLELARDTLVLRTTHAYSTRLSRPPMSMLSDQFPWYTNQLRADCTLVLPRLPDDLPSEAAAEKAYCKAVGAKSHIAVPLKAGGSILAALTITCFRSARSWPPELIEGVRLLGEIFANALARKRMDEALLASERRLRLLADSLPVLISYVDSQERYRFNNRAYEEWFDVSREDIHGCTVEQLIGEKTYKVIKGHVHKALAGEKVRFEMEIPYRRVSTRQVEASYVPHVDGRGRVLGFYALVQDVSERKRAERELHRQRDELAHVMRVSVLGELTASIAHEINQPLSAILSNAQAARRFLATDPPILPKVSTALTHIIESDKRATEVIRRLRAFLRKRELEFSEVDLTELAHEVIALVQKEILDKKVSLTLDLATGLPRVHGDRIQLQQVLLNLVLNALDAMGDDASARRDLLLRTTGVISDTVCATVSDSGVGLSDESLERLFTPFFTTKPHGLGMGLAISRSIIEVHGGRLWAEPNPAGGTAFCFCLPANSA